MIMALSVNSTRQVFASSENTAGKSTRIHVRKKVEALKKNAKNDIPKYAKTT